MLSKAALRPVWERAYETRWPAPEPPTLTPRSFVKELSMALSGSPLGRWRRMGNRIITVLAPGS